MGDTDWGMVKLGIATVTRRMGKRDAGGRDTGGPCPPLQHLHGEGNQNWLLIFKTGGAGGGGWRWGPAMETGKTGGVFGLGLGGITEGVSEACS